MGAHIPKGPRLNLDLSSKTLNNKWTFSSDAKLAINTPPQEFKALLQIQEAKHQISRFIERNFALTESFTNPARQIASLWQSKFPREALRDSIQASPDFMKGSTFHFNQGKINHLILSVEEKGIPLGHLSLFRERPDIQYTILVGSEEAKAEYLKNLKNVYWGAPDLKLRFLIPKEPARLTPWPQDPFHFVTGPKGNITGIWQDPLNKTRLDDGRMAPLISENFGIPIKDAPFVIQGGNILVTSNHIFVGQQDFWLTHRGNFNAHLSLEEYQEGLKEIFGPEKDVLIVGENIDFQASGHIDMFMTPTGTLDPETGKEIILLGDVEMAQEILANAGWVKRWEYSLALDQERVAKQKLQKGMLWFWESTAEINPQRFASSLRLAIEAPANNLQNMATALDYHAKQLEAAGYKVIRIPLINLDSGQGPLAPFITYNNALIEKYTDEAGKSVQNVMIAEYGIPELDQLAQSIYESIGFTVTPLQGFIETSSRYGSVHCGAKIAGVD